MTKELDTARIAEARRRHHKDSLSCRPFEQHLCDVFNENWTPPEPVDPDLIVAREIVKARTVEGVPDYYYFGGYTPRQRTQHCLSDLKRGRELERAEITPNVNYGKVTS